MRMHDLKVFTSVTILNPVKVGNRLGTNFGECQNKVCIYINVKTKNCIFITKITFFF